MVRNKQPLPKSLVIFIPLTLIFLSTIFFLTYRKFWSSPLPQGTTVSLIESTPEDPYAKENPPTPESVDYQVTEVAGNLYVPWSLVFTDPERILVTERSGKIRQITDNQLNPDPLIQFNEVISEGEAGLMGMDLHPNYQANHYLYVCLTYQYDNTLYNKIERLIDHKDYLARDQIIFDRIPAANNHAGCRIKFGPDSKLYITTGDALQRNLAQDLISLAGKILRLNDDGSIPTDNPFPNSPVYSYGHRNPQGLAWHPQGQLFATEHGPSGFDGPGGGDELNLIKPGHNYGWPLVSHDKTHPDTTPPLLVFTPAEAPSGALIYTGSLFPQFKNNLFFTALRGSGIFHVTLDSQDPTKTLSYQKLEIDLGRIRDIIQSPDGQIYFSTSNRDGRGQVRANDDKIYRLEPITE